jgi:hypothetical protein
MQPFSKETIKNDNSFPNYIYPILAMNFGNPDPEILLIYRTLPHKFEFSIWRNERDCVLRFELAELNALVELTVVDGDRALGPGCVVSGLAWK